MRVVKAILFVLLLIILMVDTVRADSYPVAGHEQSLVVQVGEGSIMATCVDGVHWNIDEMVDVAPEMEDEAIKQMAILRAELNSRLKLFESNDAVVKAWQLCHSTKH